MAATRPVVLVYQEFASLSSSPATPELNCMVAGPAYWIQDFPEDRASMKLEEAYGTKDAPAAGTSGAPIANVPVIEIADVPNNPVGARLDASSLRVFFGSARVEMAYGADLIGTAGSATITSGTVDFTASGVRAGDIAILSTASSETIISRVRTVSGMSLTLSDDLPNTTYMRFRIERELADAEIPASFVTVLPGTNEVTINGGVTLEGRLVTYAEVFTAYRSLRQDLADVSTIYLTQLHGRLGRVDARNPLAAGAFVALQNTPTTLQVYGIQSDDLAGYNQMKAFTAGRQDIYAVVPLTTDINVIASLKADYENLADPDYALTNGVPQKFRVVIGSAGNLPETKLVVDRQTDGVATSSSTAPGAGNHTIEFVGVDLIELGVLPGYTITLDGGLNWATVAHVNSATELETLEVPVEPASDTDVEILNLSGEALAVDPDVAVDVGPDGNLYLELTSAAGFFLDNGVMPGDILEFPANPTLSDFTTSDRLEVAAVLSNQRLRITNNGRNTPLQAYELPHGATRVPPVTALPPSTPLTFRVVRNMDQAGQVSELVAVAQSLKSRRAVLCWPDKVDVAGLVDGSLPRNPNDPSVPQAAGSQPGFYLACAVGGMTAGLPSHQGFTNLGIAGIDKLYNANTYFGDKELTQISNAGWMVFQQNSPAALPYCVHQLTTDPSTLEFGEFSMVKNLDFVAMFYHDILNAFIGSWNINKETTGFIRTAVDAGTDNLKLRKRPKIGAPVIDGRIASLGESPVAGDRLDLFLELDMPRPLNTIGLHLVSM